ncbi:MAG: hypothetical protein CL840_16210 [Crocinitomicaceae bacterium]|nr:hypothetical protein [Crocinitomicaceae bacterium]|tara:strand:+ start:115 stop:306 length:192 start_codon:yes stop_codon:yes gene_type:complete
MIEARLTFTAGVLFRRQVRRELIRVGLDFGEDKGWLDSQFVVRGDYAQVKAVQAVLQKWAGED